MLAPLRRVIRAYSRTSSPSASLGTRVPLQRAPMAYGDPVGEFPAGTLNTAPSRLIPQPESVSSLSRRIRSRSNDFKAYPWLDPTETVSANRNTPFVAPLFNPV